MTAERARAVEARETPYSFAVLRVVPHVYVGSCAAVAVVLHAPTARYIGMRALTDPVAIAARAPEVDVELLCRYLSTYQAACAADPTAGALALGSPSERFHWLTAPRSDVLQSSPVHAGLAEDPARALEDLFREYVLRPASEPRDV
jgi:hypothetical protein